MALSDRPRRIFVVVVNVVYQDHLVYVGFEAAKAQRKTCVVLLSVGRREGRNRLWFEDDSTKPPRLATVGTVRSGVFWRKAAVIKLADLWVTAALRGNQMSALGNLTAQVMHASGDSDSDEH